MRKKLKRQLVFCGLGFALLLWCTLKISYKFVTVGLIDPDTCWILALGRNIWEHKSLPLTDPFSFTLPLAAAVGSPEPFVVHQWLFDLIGYLVYLQSHLLGLCTVCAVMAVIAFVCVPWRMALRANAPPFAIYLITLFSAVSVEIRPLVRPELASCLCLAIWLALLQKLRMDYESIRLTNLIASRQFDWKTVVPFFLVMLFWCNLHTGFVAGIAVLAVYVASFVMQDISDKKKFSSCSVNSIYCLLASFIATVCNPRGIELLAYLPHMFGVSQFIDIIEMGSLLQSGEAKSADLLPFYFLVLISILAIGFYIKRGSDFGLRITSPLRLASVVLVVGAIYSSFKISRMVPFAVLILVAESVTLLARSRSGYKRPYWGLSPIDVWCKSKKIFPKFHRLDRLWEVFLVANTVLAVSFYAQVFPVLALPQVSNNFTPPMKAIEFLRSHPQSGPLFNQDLIGAVLTWYLPSVKVFVDPRFDEYGEHILKDYINIIELQRGALGTLNFYGIDWVFVPANEPLAIVLKKLPNWTLIYSDKDAIILRRNAQ